METALLIILTGILGVWIYRSVRSLSELAQAPILKPFPQNKGDRQNYPLIQPAPFTRAGKVSILIPAKNEEKNIADCVNSFLFQLREGDEVIVINNCSSDRTEQILKGLGAVEIPFGGVPSVPKAKLKYLNTPQTPDGWTGKNFALHLGVYYASGDWLLFTDADTRHRPGSVDSAVSFSEHNSVDLLTLLPRCLAHGFWENLIQPCAMAYMGLWFPVRKINDPGSKVYFGNGQYLLFRREHYQKIGGHIDVKDAFLEDFSLMKKTKEMGARGVCGFGMEVYGTRMYDTFGAIWRGWRRIYLHAFEQDPWHILRSILSVFCFSIVPFILLVPAVKTGSPIIAAVLWLVLGIIFATALKAHSIVKARKIAALLHPLASLVFTLILLDALHMALLKRPTHWR
jgi:chlorobactene glucosyltransferase